MPPGTSSRRAGPQPPRPRSTPLRTRTLPDLPHSDDEAMGDAQPLGQSPRQPERSLADNGLGRLDLTSAGSAAEGLANQAERQSASRLAPVGLKRAVLNTAISRTRTLIEAPGSYTPEQALTMLLGDLGQLFPENFTKIMGWGEDLRSKSEARQLSFVKRVGELLGGGVANDPVHLLSEIERAFNTTLRRSRSKVKRALRRRQDSLRGSLPPRIVELASEIIEGATSGANVTIVGEIHNQNAQQTQQERVQ